MGLGALSTRKGYTMALNSIVPPRRKFHMIPLTAASVMTLKYAAPLAILGTTTTGIALDSNQITLAVIAGFSGIVSTYVGFKQWRGQNDIEKARVDVSQTQARSDIHEVEIDRNNRLVDQLQEQLNAEVKRGVRYIEEVGELRREVRTLSNTLVIYEVGTYKLIGQIKDLNEEPVWTPKKPNEGDPIGTN